MSNNSTSPLYGLILSGGKSTRMGEDKGLLDYHGIPQREYLYGLLENLGLPCYLSIRLDQKNNIPNNFKVIVDNDRYRGPFNGMLTAHATYPRAAWLVLACDLPLLNKVALKNLVLKRNTNKTATAYATNASSLPEPLVAIWEPTGLQKAKEYLKTAESSCPRKYLINSDTELVFPERDEVLYNANSLSEYQFAKSKLR
ncbi:molybdenum cofactor guanylyltransferase [Allomuricauda sp. SCSIO 65647]|uniref:molybdenum cofactor guanylyltransferase n=1 Tax=Allomuricauda sp. SCSIO 65647 TaxID=2908843 RepID=UPI001F474D7B|nr:molybdenum cofactor guanylyltransferase [Muricauda sp. SCSIO 65647]UJH67309.1 molybdenum cofactor guanylyltransferase [Muricauda sp. SCSIO 65647]